MARKAPKMTDLIIEETSGVDHPAHLHEGWLVVKASNVSSVADVIATLPEPEGDSMTEEVANAAEEDAPVENAEEGMSTEEKQVEEELAVAQARIAELEARISELEGAAGADEDMMEEAADDVVALAKAAPEPLRKAMEELTKAKEEAENALAAQVGPALRRLSVMDEGLAKSVEDALLAADAQNESADIFTEVGKGVVPHGDAIEKMTSLAKAAVASGDAKTVEQALAQVAMDNPSLYNDYLTEKGA